MGDVRRRTRASTGEVELDPTPVAEAVSDTPQEPEVPKLDEAPVAKLNAQDMHRFKQQQRIIRDAQMSLSMLNCSYRALWLDIRTRYELPDQFEMDEKTGEIFAVEEPAKPNGKDKPDG